MLLLLMLLTNKKDLMASSLTDTQYQVFSQLLKKSKNKIDTILLSKRFDGIKFDLPPAEEEFEE